MVGLEYKIIYIDAVHDLSGLFCVWVKRLVGLIVLWIYFTVALPWRLMGLYPKRTLFFTSIGWRYIMDKSVS